MKSPSAILIALILICLTIQAKADDLSFGNSCTSQGSWTSKAITQGHEINAAINKLKNLPGCGGIENLIPILDAAKQSLTTESSAPEEEDQNENINGFSMALYSYLDDPSVGKMAGNGLIRQSMNKGLLAANSITKFSKRLNRISAGNNRNIQVALSLFDQVTTMIPAYSGSCLIGRKEQALPLFTGLVGLAADFASSGTSISPIIGKITSRLVQLGKDLKFANASKLVNEAELTNSLSCLLESTSEMYCSIQDADRLIGKLGVPEKADTDDPNYSFKNLPANESLAGYYVLAQHVPNVAEWVQDVQFGVPAKWVKDGEFKAEAEALVSSFKQSAFKLPGRLKDDEKTYVTLTTLESKRNYIITIIQDLIGNMGFGNGTSSTNFYAQTTNPFKMPFRLLGIEDKTPQCVYASDNGSTGCDWAAVVQKNSFIDYPIFRDPDSLIPVIEASVDSIVKDAREKASAYYQSRIIINQANLVVKALVGQNYSVRASLQYIVTYLNNLDRFFAAQMEISPDQDIISIRPALADTSGRLQRILDQFASLGDTSQLHPVKDQKDSEEVLKRYSKVIDSVYDELDILWQRDSYLTGSMTNFVKAEYSLRVRRHLGFGKYEADYMNITGHDMIKALMEVHSMDPNRIQTDLDSAGSISRLNIASLENIFTDTLMTTIEEYNQIINNADTSDHTLSMKMLGRLWRDTQVNGSAKQDEGWYATAVRTLGGPIGDMMFRKILNPDLYPISTSMKSTIRPSTDPNDFFKHMRNKLCVETLAFTNNKRFGGLCDGVILESKYKNPNPRANAGDKNPFNVYYNDMLNQQRSGVATSNNICALRDFFRKNQVYYLLRNREMQ